MSVPNRNLCINILWYGDNVTSHLKMNSATLQNIKQGRNYSATDTCIVFDEHIASLTDTPLLEFRQKQKDDSILSWKLRKRMIQTSWKFHMAVRSMDMSTSSFRYSVLSDSTNKDFQNSNSSGICWSSLDNSISQTEDDCEGFSSLLMPILYW